MSVQPKLITGRVLDGEAKPLAEVRVFFAGGPVPLQDIAALTGADGRFSLAAPVPGKYRIQFVADNFKTQTVEVDVEGGHGATQEITLEKA